MSTSCTARYAELLTEAVGVSEYNIEDFRDKAFVKGPNFTRICQKLDVHVCKKLLDEGYNVVNIQKSLIENTFYSNFYDDCNDEFLNLYCDGIFSTVKEERLFQFTKTFEKVQEQYLKSVDTIKYKYENYKVSVFNEAHIILTLLRQGYSHKIILKAMLANSPNKGKGKDYFARIMHSCLQANQRYVRIMRGPESNDYIKLAKEYLIRNKMHLLNNEAEIYIITDLLTRDLDVSTITDLLMEFSPVAVECGRASDAVYVENSIRKAKLIHQKNFEIESKNYEKTVERYKALVDKYNAEMEFSGLKNIDFNRPFYDGRIIKDMLAEGFFENNLIRVLMELSSQFKMKTSLEQDASALDYARYIMEHVQDVINRENSIKSFQHTDLKYNDAETMEKTGYNVADLYKSIVHEYIGENHNVGYRLTESYIDIETCETILKRDPSITREQYIEAIRKNSPRFAMPGVPEEYAVNLVDRYILGQAREIEERNLLEQKKRNNAAIICQDFKTEQEFSFQDNDLTKYHSCRAALMMLQGGISDNEIRDAIEETINQLGYESEETKDYSFVNNVLQGAHDVYERLEQVYNPELVPDASEAEKFYLDSMHDLCEKKYHMHGIYPSNMDVTDNMDMHVIMYMKNNDFNNDDIESAIHKYSPVAAELGRDENYSTYVIQKTEQRMEQEKIKLDNYICVPRYQKEETAEAEYEYQRKQLMSEIYLPYDQKMDVIITGILISEGFEEQDICDCIKESELNDSPKYVSQVYDTAKELLQEQNELDTLTIIQQENEYEGPELELSRDNGSPY